MIKIGSTLITDNGCGLKHNLLDNWVNQISTLNDHGIEIVIVSSGAVAEGLTRLGWDKRPNVADSLFAISMGFKGVLEICSPFKFNVK